MAPQRRPRRLLTLKQVAARLTCSEKTVLREVERGRLSPPRKVGGARHWFASDVRVYLYRLWRGDFERDGQARPRKPPPGTTPGSEKG